MRRAKPQRGEGVREREPPSPLRSFDHISLSHPGLKPVAIRLCRSAAGFLHVPCRTVLAGTLSHDRGLGSSADGLRESEPIRDDSAARESSFFRNSRPRGHRGTANLDSLLQEKVTRQVARKLTVFPLQTRMGVTGVDYSFVLWTFVQLHADSGYFASRGSWAEGVFAWDDRRPVSTPKCTSGDTSRAPGTCLPGCV
jgi:hypothetical protein